MGAAPHLDLEAIRRACRKYGVRRLQVLGSATTDRFDPPLLRCTYSEAGVLVPVVPDLLRDPS